MNLCITRKSKLLNVVSYLYMKSGWIEKSLIIFLVNGCYFTLCVNCAYLGCIALLLYFLHIFVPAYKLIIYSFRLYIESSFTLLSEMFCFFSYFGSPSLLAFNLNLQCPLKNKQCNCSQATHKKVHLSALRFSSVKHATMCRTVGISGK